MAYRRCRILRSTISLLIVISKKWPENGENRGKLIFPHFLTYFFGFFCVHFLTYQRYVEVWYCTLKTRIIISNFFIANVFIIDLHILRLQKILWIYSRPGFSKILIHYYLPLNLYFVQLCQIQWITHIVWYTVYDSQFGT